MIKVADHTIDTYCGYIAIIGKPNVGKSTLLNHLIGQKISITSRKPQTTRHQLLGIKTQGDKQAIFVDTPGLNQNNKKAIHRSMNRAASSTILDVDIILFVIDKDRWTEHDTWVMQQLKPARCPIILIVNKIDQMHDKQQLLPYLKRIQSQFTFAEMIPSSALTGLNLDRIEEVIYQYLPLGVHLFPPDQLTDRSERFMVSEWIREKITRQMGAEVPYQIAVAIESFNDDGKTIHIDALIFVEREGQKRMIIGSKGERLKKIGCDARLDMETMLQRNVMLKLWVKVKKGWTNDEKTITQLGYQ